MNAKTTPTFKAVINGVPVICNSNLADFEIIKKASSNVDYFAICRQSSQLFIQFKNGKCFLYNGVPTEVLESAKDAESIGKFYHAAIKGKYEDQVLSDNCIMADIEKEESEDDEDDLPFGPFLKRK